MDVLEGSDGFPVEVTSALGHVQSDSWEVAGVGAHVQHHVAVFGPGGSDVFGFLLQVFGVGHDPAQDADLRAQLLRYFIWKVYPKLSGKSEPETKYGKLLNVTFTVHT